MKKFRLKSISILMASAIMLSACGSAGVDNTAAETAETAEEAAEISEEVTSSNTPSDVDNTDIEEQDATEAVKEGSTESEEDIEEKPKADSEKYQFDVSGFKFCIPSEYDVQFVFGDKNGDIFIPREFKLTYENLDFDLDICDVNKWYSIYSQREISIDDFTKTDTNIDAMEYGNVEVYGLSEPYLNYTTGQAVEQYELISVEGRTRTVYIRASYKSEKYESVLAHIIPQMITTTENIIDIPIDNITPQNINIAQGKYGYNLAKNTSSPIIYAFNDSSYWNEMEIYTSGETLNIDLNTTIEICTNITLNSQSHENLKIYTMYDSERRGRDLYNKYVRYGNTEYEIPNNLISVTPMEIFESDFGDIIILYVINEYNDGEGTIRTYEQEIGIMNNNEENLLFVWDNLNGVSDGIYDGKMMEFLTELESAS